MTQKIQQLTEAIEEAVSLISQYENTGKDPSNLEEMLSQLVQLKRQVIEKIRNTAYFSTGRSLGNIYDRQYLSPKIVLPFFLYPAFIQFFA